MHIGEGALSPYRALDLTDEKGHLCGKILADLGTDVVKVEPPEGDPARRTGPFYGDVPDSEKSLRWWAFNTNKRSITLSLECASDRDKLKKLTRTADFLIESFPPGYMEAHGLGYPILAGLNPGLIYVSITPFGQTGPYRDYKVTDLTAMALGGQMYISGDRDRPPVRLSVEQAYLHAGLNAAAGCLIALQARHRTGRGQAIDVSIQESIARTLGAELVAYEYAGEVLSRFGPLRPRGPLLIRDIWPCKDGYLTMKLLGGPRIRQFRPLFEWIAHEKQQGSIQDIDWNDLGDFVSYAPEVETWHEIISQFLQSRTVREIYHMALRDQVPIMPCHDLGQLRQDEQLIARKFWVAVKQRDIPHDIIHPGAPFKLSQTPWRISHPAPQLGEHNEEVLAEWASPGSSHQASLNGSHRNPSVEADQALEGIKIADFSWILTGPLATKYLADFGATVVKIESRSRLDNSRINRPFKDGIVGVNQAGSFQTHNNGKLSLTLNLSNAWGRDVVKKLVAWADVVVENFAPGTMERWELAYPQLKKINPSIVMLSASIQGQDGPHSDHPGYGWNLSGLAGFNHLTGWPDRGPISPHTAYTDWIAPAYGVIAILAALDYRRRTGKGQHIDLSQLEAGLSFLSIPLLDLEVNRRSETRKGNSYQRACPHNAYPCQGTDRWCAIAISEEKEWQSLTQVMGYPIWMGDPRFATLEGRREHEEELDRLVATWTLSLSAEEVMDRLQKAGVAAGVVQSAEDLLKKDPQLRHRLFFQYVVHPEMGPVLAISEPLKLTVTPANLRPAPCLGQHTEYVCRELLRMSGNEFAELKASGALN